jgi:hypothetical protein
MSLSDAAQDALNCLDGVDDGAEEAQLAFRAGFGNGDGDGVFMDIETEVECNSRHWCGCLFAFT